MPRTRHNATQTKRHQMRTRHSPNRLTTRSITVTSATVRTKVITHLEGPSLDTLDLGAQSRLLRRSTTASRAGLAFHADRRAVATVHRILRRVEAHVRAEREVSAIQDALASRALVAGLADRAAPTAVVRIAGHRHARVAAAQLTDAAPAHACDALLVGRARVTARPAVLRVARELDTTAVTTIHAGLAAACTVVTAETRLTGFSARPAVHRIAAQHHTVVPTLREPRQTRAVAHRTARAFDVAWLRHGHRRARARLDRAAARRAATRSPAALRARRPCARAHRARMAAVRERDRLAFVAHGLVDFAGTAYSSPDEHERERSDDARWSGSEHQHLKTAKASVLVAKRSA
jgi:hypothetical protein